MKNKAVKVASLITSLLSLSGCGFSNESKGEVSIVLDKFETTSNMPYAYVEEDTHYLPVSISFKKTGGDNIKSIDSFAITANKAVSIFKDINNNKTLDADELEYSGEIHEGLTWINFLEDESSKNNDEYFTATYLLCSKDKIGFEDCTTVSFGNGVKTTTSSNQKITVETDASKNGPSSIVLLYNKPEKHLEVIQEECSDLYNAKFSFKRIDNVFKVVSVENAALREDGYYYYEGLDGEITIKYELVIKGEYNTTNNGLDPYYKGKNVHFGTGEFKYKLSLNKHDHNVSLSGTIEGMNSYSCDCGYFKAYELDTSKAKNPTVPDLNDPSKMMGNEMFHVEWDVTGISKGRYKAYVHGSTRDDQKDLEWFTKLDETMSRCPCYIRINETEKQPCTSKTYGETFGTGSSWRWTNDYIFDIEIPEGLETLSIHSGNNNGNLNEWNFFFRGLLLVPFCENITPNNL